jgi:hypothetical protein
MEDTRIMATSKPTTTRAKPASVAKPTPTHSQIFEGLDQIDQALSKVGHTAALLAVLLEDSNDDLLHTFERHLLSDLAALHQAKARAWDNLLRKGGDQ